MIQLWKITRLGLLMMMTMALTHCTSVTPPPSTKMDWKSRERALNHLQNWQLSGKVAIQTPQDSGSASIEWTQQAKRFHLSLLGPLGSGGFQLSGQPGLVTLVTANGKRYSAKTAEQLLAQQTGFHLPLAFLNYWIRGLPAPASPYQSKMDSYHRIRTLIQQNWQIEFLSYTHTGRIDLPEKVTIVSPSLKVKVIIYHWKV